MSSSSLQPALHRAQVTMDSLSDGAVILDRFGNAWQLGRYYWYRAYGDSTEVSSWELAQRGPIKVLHDLNRCPSTVKDRKGKERPCDEPAKRWQYDEITGGVKPACDAHQTFASAIGEAP